MNKKSTKILLVISFISIFIIGGGALYLKQRLNPKKLKSDLIIYVEKNYPNLGVKLGDISVSLGLNTDIEIKSISLTNKGKEVPSELLVLSKGTVKLPIFNILTGGGTIRVVVEKPFLNFIEGAKINNWSEGFKKREEAVVALPANVDKNEKSIGLPALLAKSQINADFMNVTLNRVKGEEKSRFLFDEIQFKDIGIKRPMAFKLNSVISVESKEKISFKINSIGELNLQAFIEDKVVQSKMVTKINDLKYGKLSILKEELSVDTNILFRKNNTGRIEVSINNDNLIKNKSQIIILNEETRFEIESFQIALQPLFNQFNLNIKGFGLNESWLDVSGSFIIGKDSKLTPTIVLKPTKALAYNFDGNFISIERTSLSLKEDQVELATSLNAFKGRIDISAGNTIDINEPIDFSKLDVFKASVVANGLEVNKDIFKASGEQKKVEKKKNEPFLPPFHLSLELKNIMIENEVINGTGEILGTKKELAIKNLTIRHDEGQLVVSANSKNIEKSPEHSFNIETKNLSTKLFNSLLEKETPQFIGIVNASAVGKLMPKGKSLDYDVFLKGDSTNGELLNFDLSSLINGYVAKVNTLPFFKKKPLKDVKIPQDYDRISFDFHIKTNETKIKKLNFIGVKKKIEARSQGAIAMESGSEMYINFYDTKKNYLKFLDEVEMKHFPVRLEGIGVDLKPDYNFTINQISKNAQKKLKKKAKKAAEKAVKKELDKIKDKVLQGKKPKELLKDLFQ